MRSTRAALAVLLAHRPRHTPPPPSWPQVWWDDYIESGDHWTVVTGAGDCLHEPAAAAAYAGAYGLLLRTRATGATEGDILEVTQNCLPPTKNYLALSLQVRLPTKTNTAAVICALGITSGGHLYRANLMHLIASNKWQYTNWGGADVDVPAGGYTWPNNTWVALTLRLQVAALKYGTFDWPGGTADLSAQGLWDVGVTAGSYAQARVRVVASATPPATVHADHFVLTHSPNPP